MGSQKRLGRGLLPLSGYLLIVLKVRGVLVYSSSCKPISKLRSVTCHMGSHSVTCPPAQVNAPCLNPSQHFHYLICLLPEGWKAELTWVLVFVFSLWVPLDIISASDFCYAFCRDFYRQCILGHWWNG